MNSNITIPLALLNDIEKAIVHMHQHNLTMYKIAFVEPGTAYVVYNDGLIPPSPVIHIQTIIIERTSYARYTVQFPNATLTFEY
jgi:hypothetical protein